MKVKYISVWSVHFFLYLNLAFLGSFQCFHTLSSSHCFCETRLTLPLRDEKGASGVPLRREWPWPPLLCVPAGQALGVLEPSEAVGGGRWLGVSRQGHSGSWGRRTSQSLLAQGRRCCGLLPGWLLLLVCCFRWVR